MDRVALVAVVGVVVAVFSTLLYYANCLLKLLAFYPPSSSSTGVQYALYTSRSNCAPRETSVIPKSDGSLKQANQSFQQLVI